MLRPTRSGLLPLTVSTMIAFTPANASADFLGLAPGDYDVVLEGSSALCAGNDCIGTIHVPLGVAKTDVFDWSFEIGGELFDWTGPGLGTSVSPNSLNSCAIEGTSGALCAMNDSGVVPSLNEAPFLVLFAIAGSFSYTAALPDEVFAHGTVEASPASPVPEPSSGLLLVCAAAIGAGIRRFRVRGCSI